MKDSDKKKTTEDKKEKTAKKDKKTIDEKQEIKKSVEKQASEKEPDFNIDIEEMEKLGIYFGHHTTKLHPKMKPYLESVKNTIHIIDLKKTKEKLTEALKFIQEIISQNKVLLFVGTKIQVKDLIKETAEKCGLPYVNERWLGGYLTNFPVMKKRIDRLKDIEKSKQNREWEKYTKKERIKINKEFENLRIKFEGIKNLEQLPYAIFILDIKKDYLAVKEAGIKGVKVIAICDTNVDPSLVDYPIPANDDAVSSVKYILKKIEEVILKSKST